MTNGKLYIVRFSQINAFRFLLILLFVFSANIVCAQTQESKIVELAEVDILSERYEVLTGFSISKIDSATISENTFNSLDEILTKSSPILIKTYGLGSLATASFRGSAASHTQVNWNGIPINNPALGITDLATIPTMIANEINITHGGGSLKNGTGGLGGSVELYARPDWNSLRSLEVDQLLGSFGKTNTQVKAGLGNDLIQFDGGLVISGAKNNFPYINKTEEGSPVEQLEHAAISQQQTFANLFVRTGKKSMVVLRSWLGITDREIPATLSSGYSHATLNYGFFRNMIEWQKYLSEDRVLSFKSAYNSDYTLYDDSVTKVKGDHQTTTYVEQFRYRSKEGQNYKFETGIDYLGESSESNVYAKERAESRVHVSSFMEMDYTKFQNISFGLHIRQSFVNKELTPFIFGLGSEWKVLNSLPLKLKGNFSRNYKLPALHDLYWHPGGNPTLKPEQGWTKEIGFSYEWFTKRVINEFQVSTSLYQSDIHDRIIWAPNSGNYWLAQNLSQVRSQGIESAVSFSVFFQTWKATLKNTYIYTSSIDRSITSTDTAVYNKQLLYIPFHSNNTHLRIEKKNVFVLYDYYYSGVKFTSTDNSTFLPGFGISDISCGFKRVWSPFCVILGFSAKNILNLEYQAIANRPMVGRNFEISLKLRVEKQKIGVKRD